jgi:hypothetical protein
MTLGGALLVGLGRIVAFCNAAHPLYTIFANKSYSVALFLKRQCDRTLAAHPPARWVGSPRRQRRGSSS